MKKIITILALILLSYVSAHAETVEVFVCKPKKTSNKYQAKNDYNFMLVSNNLENKKFVTYDIQENVALAHIYNEEFLKSKGIKNYKSYTEWGTYEYNFWDYFPGEYTVTGLMLTERKDGRLVLSATVLTTSEYYYKEFSESKKERELNKNNNEKYLEMFLKDTKRIGDHHYQRWNDSQNISSSVKRALLGWNCNKA